MKRLRKLQETLPTEDFTPRDYQLDLLEHARQENTVAALGSDGGKSFLALSLLRELMHHSQHGAKALPKKVAFITVETDDAADSYVRAVEDHTDFSAIRLTDGASDALLKSHDVVVSSHQNFVNLMSSRSFDPDDISVIAVDECTSAVAKYPYGELFHSAFPGFRNGTVESLSKPRILALTSSLLTKAVVSDPSTLEKVIVQLERVFRSSLRTSVGLVSVDRFGYQKAVKVIPFSLDVGSTLQEGTTYVQTKLLELRDFVQACMHVAKLPKVERADCLVHLNAFNVFEVAATETLECLHVLGLWPTYRLINIITRDFRNTYLKNLMEQRISRLLLAVTCRFQEIGIALEKMYGFGSMTKGDPRILDFATEKLKLVVAMLDPYNPQNPDEGKAYIPVNFLNVIINVSRPYLAWAVNRFLRDLKSANKDCKSRYHYVTSAYCLGSFSSESVSPSNACLFGMPFKVQEEILRRFRNRDFNVLVSTCTNDISLDVPQCTFSIQFDPVYDYLTFINARHRTKSKYGTTCIMVQKSDEQAYHKEYFEKFLQIDAIVLSRCPDLIVRNSGEVPDPVALAPPVKAHSTGVQITLGMAIGVINRYCSNLPSDAFANLTPLSYIISTNGDEPTFRCKLTLPINAPLKDAIMGSPMPSPRLAKQSAALEACRKLYLLKELDESLAPVNKDTWKIEIARLISLEPPEVILDGAAKPGTTKRRQYYTKKIPDVFLNAIPSAGDHCFLYFIDMTLVCPVPQEQNVRGRKIRHPEESPRMLAILTTKRIPRIPDFNVYDRSGEIQVSIRMVRENVIVTQQQLDWINHFHYVLFSNVLSFERYSLSNSPEKSPSQFLIVPVFRGVGIEIDWDFMEGMYKRGIIRVALVPEGDREKVTPERYEDTVVMPWYRSVDQPQSFYVEQICPWLTVKCEFPDDDFETFDAYYAEKYKLNIQDKDQPLLDVDHTSTRLNLLLPRYLSRKGSSLTQTEKKELLKDKESRHRQIFVPELCEIHPVPASLWRQAVCLPSILHRTETLLVMEELLTAIRESTGIGQNAVKTGSDVSWPLLDYGWNFMEKIKQIDSLQLERDDLDIRNASIIEKARLKHESAQKTKALPTIGMWNANDPDGTEMEIGTWNNGDQSDDTFTIDTWIPTSGPVSHWNPAGSVFDHVTHDSYTASRLQFGDPTANNFSRVAVRPVENLHDEDQEWGYDNAGGTPGISLVSGFSDNVMQAIEKDLTNMDLDDTGMTNSDAGNDMETIADSIMTALPSYNLEALDPLKDREEEDFGPVMSSILHLRFSESAPDDFRGRGDSPDVFEEMSDFVLDGVSSRPKRDEKKKDSRAEFGEVKRGVVESVQPVVPNGVTDNRPLQPPFKFDDDLDPLYVTGPDPGILLQAFTASNANDGINLERLETVGDSFLKFSVTTYLYFRHSGYHEGKLSFMRSLQVSNYHLYRLGFKKGLGEILVSSKFEPTENWLPPCYVVTDGSDTTREKTTEWPGSSISSNLRTEHCISDKTLADCVESLIGAYLISSGVKAAQLLMSWLGLVVLPERPEIRGEKCMTDRYTWFPRPATVLLTTCRESMQELDRLLHGYDKFEERIGYRFNDRAYLLQAFTHASYIYNRITDCYQRLEFLGDAVLDYLITRHLYEDLRDHTPGALTDLRSALVNNSIFASLSVRNEFHKYVKLMSPAIFHLVEKYVKEQRERDQNVTLFTEDIYFYDPAVDEDALEDEGGAEETECPKVLGDIFESVAGAIYLDSGMSLDAVWKVYYAMMKSEIDQCSSIIPKSPVRELLELEPENVKFSIPERTASGKIRVVVEIFDKGKFVGLGRNYRTAKCTAAKQALKYLHSLDETRAT